MNEISYAGVLPLHSLGTQQGRANLAIFSSTVLKCFVAANLLKCVQDMQNALFGDAER